MSTAVKNGSRIKTEGSSIDALLEAMESASADDLEKLKAQIAEEESQLELLVAGRRRKIDSLARLASMIDLRLNGKPKREIGQRGGAALSPLRRKIRNWLLEQDGPQKPAAIAEGLGKRVAAIYAALQHPAFQKGDEGFVVAEQANQGSE